MNINRPIKQESMITDKSGNVPLQTGDDGMNDYIKDLKQMKFSKDSKEKRNVEQQDCSTFEGSVSEKA